MKTPLTNWKVAEETVKLPGEHDRPATAESPEFNHLEPNETSSNQFADKLRLLQSYCRHAHFILHRRRRGKLAGLPGPIREQINLMLRDGLPYRAIIGSLGETGKHLNKDNLSRWRKADYQDWLAEQTWLEITAHRPESRPAIKALAFLLHEMDSDTLRAAVARSPNAFVRFCNVAARATALSVDSFPAPMPHGLPQVQHAHSKTAEPTESNHMKPNPTNSRIKCSVTANHQAPKLSLDI